MLYPHGYPVLHGTGAVGYARCIIELIARENSSPWLRAVPYPGMILITYSSAMISADIL